MKSIFKLPILLIIFFVLTISSHVFARSASAARLLFSPSTGTIVGTTQIEVRIDTEDETVESAVAVVTYNHNNINIVGITAGDFFDNVASDATKTGELAITGTLSYGATQGVTGSGKLATLTISPKITTGTISLAFRCSSTASDDSNILVFSTGVNLLETDAQCARNIAGSYTVGAAQAETQEPSPTATPSATTKGDQPVMPEALPEAGPRNWLRWLTSGLALIGIGLLLL